MTETSKNIETFQLLVSSERKGLMDCNRLTDGNMLARPSLSVKHTQQTPPHTSRLSHMFLSVSKIHTIYLFFFPFLCLSLLPTTTRSRNPQLPSGSLGLIQYTRISTHCWATGVYGQPKYNMRGWKENKTTRTLPAIRYVFSLFS